MQKLPPYIKIMAGMAIGVIVGLSAAKFGYNDAVTNWISPFGDIFLRLLKLIAIPLVLISLIKGIGSLQDVSKLATIGGRTALLYVCSTLLAISLGVAIVSIIRPGDVVSDEISQSLHAPISGSLEESRAQMDMAESMSPLQPLVDIVPENAIKALGDNASMLQVILIAMLIGVSAILVGNKTNRPFIEFISSLDAIIIKCIDIAMMFAPIGVMALIAGVVSDSAGDSSLLSALGLYVVTVALGLFLLMVVIYPTIISLTTDIKYMEFLRAMFPVQLMGFSTSSSAATLATTMKMCNDVLRLPKNITSFTLPLGVTINMDGTSIYQAILVIFIAQVMNIDLTTSQLLIIIATTTLSSIGTPGVPGGSIVVSMMVLTAADIPVEGLALVMGVDRPLDMLRTSVNVTGDVAVSALVSKSMAHGVCDSQP